MKYTATLKHYYVRDSVYTIYPDGFGTWTIKNTGNATVTLNNTIIIKPGETLHYKLDSDTRFQSQITMRFDTTPPETGGLNIEALVMLTYCKEV